MAGLASKKVGVELGLVPRLAGGWLRWRKHIKKQETKKIFF